MSNIPQWYDYREHRYRDDIWPFEQGTRAENMTTAAHRRMARTRRILKAMPAGWSVRWARKRNHALRVESGEKRIKAPFPKTSTGLAPLAAGVLLAQKINDAYNSARYSRRPVGAFVRAIGFLDWHLLQHREQGKVPQPHTYGDKFDFMRIGCPEMAYYIAHRRAKLNGQYARETLRFLLTPAAWSIPRRIGRRPARAPIIAEPVVVNSDVLTMVSYICMLRDYLRVNKIPTASAYKPLPAAALAATARANTALQPQTTTP